MGSQGGFVLSSEEATYVQVLVKSGWPLRKEDARKQKPSPYFMTCMPVFGLQIFDLEHVFRNLLINAY